MDIVLYLSIILFSVIQSACVKVVKGPNENGIVFNAIKALSALFLFGILCLGGISFDQYTFICGGAYGISLAISMYAGYKALLCGPMALSSMIVSFSVLIPILFGILYFDEKVTLLKGVGLFFFVLAIYFSAKKKKDAQKDSTEKTKSTYGSWSFFLLTTFLANGLCSVLQKLHQAARPSQFSTEFMLFAMLFCGAIYCIITFIKIKPRLILRTDGKRFAFCSGISNAIVNYFTLILAGSENATVLFPMISVGTILGALLCGILFFREKAGIRQGLALLFGITAIVFLKL